MPSKTKNNRDLLHTRGDDLRLARRALSHAKPNGGLGRSENIYISDPAVPGTSTTQEHEED
tara:strand:- start:2585 stop:2767 length:183 start_codon:yes stop_codon:yes gene_type:complete